MTKTTFNNLPESIDDLRQDVSELSKKVELLLSSEKKQISKQRIPVRIDKAKEITGLSIPTLYVKARNGEIPSYKAGKFIFFYEEDLIGFIENGRRKTSREIIETASIYNLVEKRNR